MSHIVSLLTSQDIFTDSSVQQHPLGTKSETNDGRVYRYCKAGTTALAVGKLQQNAAQDANFNLLSVADAAIGAVELTVTLNGTAVTASLFKEGFVIIDGGTGAGQCYKIQSHSVQTSTTGALTVKLEDPVVTALVSATVCLKRNPYDAVIVAPVTPTGAIVGIAVYPITASYFGWVQVGGIAPALSDATEWAVGDMVGFSLTEGAAMTAALIDGKIGNALGTGASGTYRPIMLSI